MTPTVEDIIKIMETIAPSRLAEEWDNVGLQVGQKGAPVRTIRVSLDPQPDVVAAACKSDIDLLITHHPLIFQPLKTLDFDTPLGSVIHKAIKNNLSIYSAHTNLDSAPDGINDILAAKIGLKNLKILQKSHQHSDSKTFKLVLYAPIEYEEKILNALFETNAGKIGAYSCCSFRNPGKGIFRPLASAKPFSGKIGEVSHVNEVRIETVVKENDLPHVVAHLKKHHPYETMAYDVYEIQASGVRIQNPESSQQLPANSQQPTANSQQPTANSQHQTPKLYGLGRIGELDEETDLASFGLKIKEALGLSSLRIVGKPDLLVKKVAVCSGSGSSLMRNFFSSGAQAYISGDLRYHDARDAETLNLGLIDIGHFASEHLVVEVLAHQLQKRLLEAEINVTVEAYGFEKEPFLII